MSMIAGTLEAGALFVAATIMAARIAIGPALMAVIAASSFVVVIIATFGTVITARTFVVAGIGFIVKVSERAVIRLTFAIARWAT